MFRQKGLTTFINGKKKMQNSKRAVFYINEKVDHTITE